MKIRVHLAAALALLVTASGYPPAPAAEMPADPGKDRVTFTGRLDSVSCPAVCGACCGALGALAEKNDGFSGILVGAAAVTLEPYRDAGTWHGFGGYFYEGIGSCDSGRCTLFFVESVDQPVPADSSLDSSAWRLRIPSLVLDGRERYGIQWDLLTNEVTAESLPVPTTVAQSGDCSDPATRCGAGLSCVPYYGIAGPAGPLFMTCEIPCTSDRECPADQDCGVVADGPGQVCVPRAVP